MDLLYIYAPTYTYITYIIYIYIPNSPLPLGYILVYDILSAQNTSFYLSFLILARDTISVFDKKPWNYAWFSLYWDFYVESKVIILIVSDPPFIPHPPIGLCSAHLSVVRGITFSDRSRVADGQQMGVLPDILVQILAQAETVRDCQFVLTACGLQSCVWHHDQGSELMQSWTSYWSFWLVNG